jgi:hypothetical protein
MIPSISPEFCLDLEREQRAAQKELNLYKVARIATFVGLAALQVGIVILTHFLAPQLTVFTVSASLPLIPTICMLATASLSPKISALKERLHHFSESALKAREGNLNPVSARLAQIQDDINLWHNKREALLAEVPASEKPYFLRKKAYRMQELCELPLKIQAAYLSHLLHHPTERRSLPHFGHLNLIKSYKGHLDTLINDNRPRPFFIGARGKQIPRQIIEHGTIDALRIHLFGR